MKNKSKNFKLFDLLLKQKKLLPKTKYDINIPISMYLKNYRTVGWILPRLSGKTEIAKKFSELYNNPIIITNYKYNLDNYGCKAMSIEYFLDMHIRGLILTYDAYILDEINEAHLDEFYTKICLNKMNINPENLDIIVLRT